MDTSAPGLAVAGPVDVAPQSSQNSAPPITADVLMKALKENREFIINSLTSNMNALAKKVDKNTGRTSANSVAISRQAELSSKQRTDIDRLEERVKRLESGGVPAAARVSPGPS